MEYYGQNASFVRADERNRSGGSAAPLRGLAAAGSRTHRAADGGEAVLAPSAPAAASREIKGLPQAQTHRGTAGPVPQQP